MHVKLTNMKLESLKSVRKEVELK